MYLYSATRLFWRVVDLVTLFDSSVSIFFGILQVFCVVLVF